jgi:hypothetical protein
MAEREVLEAIFQNSADMTPSHLKPQLAYRHMIALADSYDGWAQDQRMSPERSAQLLGWADGMRRLADEVGPEWNPPTPATVSITGSLGRWALNEPSPPATPQLHNPRNPLRKDSALASPLEIFRRWTLSIACAVCVETRSLAIEQVGSFAKKTDSVGSVIGRLRCRACGAAPSWVQLGDGPDHLARRKVRLV